MINATNKAELTYAPRGLKDKCRVSMINATNKSELTYAPRGLKDKCRVSMINATNKSELTYAPRGLKDKCRVSMINATNTLTINQASQKCGARGHISKTAFTRYRQILKTVKNSTDRPHTKTAYFLPADFANGRF